MRIRKSQISLAAMFGLLTAVAVCVGLCSGIFQRPCDEWWSGQSEKQLSDFVKSRLEAAKTIDAVFKAPSPEEGAYYDLEAVLQLTSSDSPSSIKKLADDFQVTSRPPGGDLSLLPTWGGQTIDVTVWPKKETGMKTISFIVIPDDMIIFRCFGDSGWENSGRIDPAFYWTLESIFTRPIFWGRDSPP